MTKQSKTTVFSLSDSVNIQMILPKGFFFTFEKLEEDGKNQSIYTTV